MRKRRIDISVISDVHLGTYGCHADELIAYLSSIKPKKLILNGDIIDIWQFDKKYFPPSHLKVLRKIISMASSGTEVYYITGNHDEVLRKFADQHIGNFHLVNKLALNLDGKLTWVFHGDIFDISMKPARWIAQLGSYGYSILIRINHIFNWLRLKTGRGKYSLSSRIKNSAEGESNFVRKFVKTATGLAIENGYDYVICGHIHQPGKAVYETKIGSCTYLNSGDWVDNLTALEYSFKRWKIYRYCEDKLSAFYADEELKEMDMNELITSIVEIRNKSRKEKDGESVEE